MSGLGAIIAWRTTANRIDAAARLCVRTAAAWRLFPLGRALPSTSSAGSHLPLFGRFFGTMARSDSSLACMFSVRLLTFLNRPEQRSGHE